MAESSSGGGPSPSIVDNYKVKALLLSNALTSNYVCRFEPPEGAIDFLTQGGFNYRGRQELIELSCSEASLPGSSMMTNEINDDHTGVTERHAYRRQYDDRIDFTFYVDRNYDIITFFERWISYCAGENNQEELNFRNYSYRVNFPIDYQTDALYVTKFERDVFGTALEYKFIGAYPISITSMPISYDSSQLLKCTVSFTYIRYVRKVIEANRPTEPSQTTAPGVPPITTPTGDQINVPLPPTTTDGRPVPSFPVGPVTAAGVPSTLGQQPNAFAANRQQTVPFTVNGQQPGASIAGRQQNILPENVARATNPVIPLTPDYNKAAGTGAIFDGTLPGAPTTNNRPGGQNSNARPGAPTTNARPGSPTTNSNLPVL